MNSKDVYDRFKESNKNNTVICTEKDLSTFLAYGILIQCGNKYITRNGITVNLDLIKTKYLTFNVNLQGLINNCENVSKEIKYTKIYCMTERCYNKYKQDGLIVQHKGKDYYRLFDKDLWLVQIY